MGVFYIDFEHAKDMFQICKWLQGSMRKTWYLHQKCMLPTIFPSLDGFQG